MADSSDVRPTPKGTPAKAGGSFITAKVGPFPVWVYMVVIVVGVYIYTQKKKTVATAPATAANGAAGGYGSAANGQPGAAGTGVSGPQTELEYALAANAGQATTNPQWEANAESVLVGQGYPYVQIQSALNNYLAGGVLSSIQQEIVNAAILAVGQPPSAPAATAASTTSTASPTTATPATAAPVNPQSQLSGEGYTYISTPQEGSNLSAEGVPVEVAIGGAGGPIVPFKSGVQYAPGSEEVYQTGATP